MDLRGWKPFNGEILLASMSIVPDYCHADRAADHCWLEHTSETWLDLTADQSGMPDILIGPKSNQGFMSHRAAREEQPLRSLLRAVRNWEGAEGGTSDLLTLGEQAEE